MDSPSGQRQIGANWLSGTTNIGITPGATAGNGAPRPSARERPDTRPAIGGNAPMQVNPLHPIFAAELVGADLTQPPTPALVRTVEDAMARYGVLVVRDAGGDRRGAHPLLPRLRAAGAAARHGPAAAGQAPHGAGDVRRLQPRRERRDHPLRLRAPRPVQGGGAVPHRLFVQQPADQVVAAARLHRAAGGRRPPTSSTPGPSTTTCRRRPRRGSSTSSASTTSGAAASWPG